MKISRVWFLITISSLFIIGCCYLFLNFLNIKGIGIVGQTQFWLGFGLISSSRLLNDDNSIELNSISKNKNMPNEYLEAIHSRISILPTAFCISGCLILLTSLWKI